MIDGRTYTLDEIEESTGFDRRTVAYYVQQGLLPKVGRRGPKTRYSQLFFDRLNFIRMIRDLQDQGAMGTVTLSDFRDLFRSVPEELIAEIVSGRLSLDVIGDRLGFGPPEMASPRARAALLAKKITDLRRRQRDDTGPETSKSAGMPMDPAREPSPVVEPEETFIARAYRPLRGDRATEEDLKTALAESRGLNIESSALTLGSAGAERFGDPAQSVEEELREALGRLQAVVNRQPRAYLRTTESWTQARITGELGLTARGLDDRDLPLLERVAQILRFLLRN